MNNNSLSKKPLIRQASNIKQKKLTMAVIDTELNSFQKTQIGFKRLLKTPATNPSLIKLTTTARQKEVKNVDVYEGMAVERLAELLEIPREYAIKDLIINPREQWARNMQRAGNLITVVSRWNAFHRRFWAFVSSEQSSLLTLMKKMIKLDGCLLSYKTAFQQQPLATILSIILQSAPKNTLIQQQLNKLGRQFVAGHEEVMLVVENKQTEGLITVLHECYQKVGQRVRQDGQLEPAQWIEGLTVIEQGFDNAVSKVRSNRMRASMANSVANVFRELLYQHLGKQILLYGDKYCITSTTLKFIIQNAEFCQLAFQILYSLIGKIANMLQTPSGANSFLNNSSTLIKMNQSGSSFSKKLKPMEKTNQKMVTTLSRLTTSNKATVKGNKSLKSLFGILWNISKYFDKLQKQLALKEKKKKQQQKVQLIKDFIKTESQLFGTTIHLICSKQNEELYLKSLASLQQYYKQFKVKIEQLKEEMAKTNG